ncbi:MAG: glycosyltransferase family 39 protein [Solirubrobacteraceae bacterium]
MLLGGTVALVLVAFASGYGYHRDELYFLAAGRHLDWAYADQGPITPLIARAMSELAAGSVTVLRLPSALATGVIVLLTGRLAGELGGSLRAERIAAACAAASGVLLFTGHILSTTTFDLLVWTTVVWLAVRAVRRGEDRLWPVAGAVLGLGMLNKPLPAFLALGALAGIAIAGPRRLLRSRYVWAGAAMALALSAPWVLWQNARGWPQIDVSRSIAGGGSTSSQPWWAVVPYQVLLASPPLAPIWIAGLVRLLRDPELRDVRFLGVTWVVLACVFMATGGKPYYLAGLLPVLIAAGAGGVDRWLERGRAGARKGVLAVAVAGSAAVAAVIALPVLPAHRAGIAVALNADVGETIGWPRFAQTVASVYRSLPDPRRAVILTGNYGEAGAIDRFGPGLGLPAAYSGHNAYGGWRVPPEGSAPAVAVGLRPHDLAELGACTVAGRIDNGVGIDDEEQGEAVFVCQGPRRGWSELWPALRHLG